MATDPYESDPLSVALEKERLDAMAMAIKYEMHSAISIAWLGFSLTSENLGDYDRAWDTLVVRPEWRDWQEANLHTNPFLYLAVRDALDERRLRKTRTGVSMHVPAAEVYAATQAGTTIDLFREIIWIIYDKWAKVSGCEPPPSLTLSR